MYPSGLSKEKIVEMLLSAAEAVGMLKPEQIPAKGKWWSMKAAMAGHVLCNSVNNLLRDAFHLAYPTWGHGVPDIDENEDPAVDQDHRLMVRSRVWRSKLYLDDASLKRAAACVLLLAEPLDHMAMSIQHLTASEARLLVVLLHDHSNPLA